MSSAVSDQISLSREGDFHNLRRCQFYVTSSKKARNTATPCRVAILTTGVRRTAIGNRFSPCPAASLERAVHRLAPESSDDAGRQKQAERLRFGIGFHVAHPCLRIFRSMDSGKIVPDPVFSYFHVVTAIGMPLHFRIAERFRRAAVLYAAAGLEFLTLPSGRILAAPVAGKRRRGYRKN